ncbi:MAG: hypothetical protein JSV79_11880 [Armatimonadota bacterium]|nr:MAG: hypothetical protein JSV79_11880 [Armatimonadota bacterium]
MSFWHVTKWVGLVIMVLVLAVTLARLFSGPEDAWVRDASGKWVAHGHPAGPPPAEDYRPPATERVLPLVVLVIAVAGLAAALLLSGRAPASREGLERNLRFYGALSLVSGALAVATAAALAATLAQGFCCGPGAEPLSNQSLFVILTAAGFAALLGLLALHAQVTKKVLEAHYDLKRTAALLQDTVERLAESLPKPTPP